MEETLKKVILDIIENKIIDSEAKATILSNLVIKAKIDTIDWCIEGNDFMLKHISNKENLEKFSFNWLVKSTERSIKNGQRIAYEGRKLSLNKEKTRLKNLL